MGVQPCGLKMIRRCERAVGVYVLRVVGRGGSVFEFVTDDHRHGEWNQKTGEVAWSEPAWHWSSCAALFGPDAVDQSLWGLVDSDGKWRALEWGAGKPLPP